MKTETKEPTVNKTTEPRTYMVHIRERRLFWATVQVEASSEAEAIRNALGEFQGEWDDSDCIETDVAIIGS